MINWQSSTATSVYLSKFEVCIVKKKFFLIKQNQMVSNCDKKNKIK